MPSWRLTEQEKARINAAEKRRASARKAAATRKKNATRAAKGARKKNDGGPGSDH